MPSFVPGKRSSTAAARRCAVEWRSTSRPASVAGRMGSISTARSPCWSDSSRRNARSTSRPLTFAARACPATSVPSRSRASPTVVPAHTSPHARSLMWTCTSSIARTSLKRTRPAITVWWSRALSVRSVVYWVRFVAGRARPVPLGVPSSGTPAGSFRSRARFGELRSDARRAEPFCQRARLVTEATLQRVPLARCALAGVARR